MLSRPLLLLALAALATIGVATPAAAACCECAVPCAPHIVAAPAPAYAKHVHVRRHHIRRVHVKRYVKPFYIVDQGPVYSGPAILTAPRIEPFNRPLAHYPVMLGTYYYPTYRDSYTVPPWHQPWQAK
jgi:hypothetical protein